MAHYTQWLDTHLHIIGPPGTGKTRLLLWFFQKLAQMPKATVILMNPKGDLCHLARDWSISHGHMKRLVLLDPSDQQIVVGYNPMKPNELPVATHAKAVREAIRSAWGQSSFDSTPQMARMLYMALATARTCELTLVDAAELLRSNSDLRRQLLPKITDPFLRKSLQWFETLRPNRQEELASSALARLEPFISDPPIRRMLTQNESLDLGAVMANHKILLVNLELYGPHRMDDIRLIGRMLVNDIVARVFARRRGQRTPVYLLLDEVQNFATADLCAALDMGRELGLHCILAHQDLGQLREGDDSGKLYSSVMGSARTKCVFGGLNEEDLQVIAKETMLDQWNPLIVKHEIRTLELDPILKILPVLSESESQSESIGSSRGTSRTSSEGWTTSSSESSGESSSKGKAHSRGMGKGTSIGLGMSHIILPSGDPLESAVASETSGSSGSSFEGRLNSTLTGSNKTRGTSEGRSRNTGEGESESSSETTSKGSSWTVTHTPFYEYVKRYKVSSRTFLSEQEFLRMSINVLKAQPKAHYAVKVPGVPIAFLKAPLVSDPKLRPSDRDRALQEIHLAPFYRPIREVLEEEAREAQAPKEKVPQVHSLKSKAAQKREQAATTASSPDEPDDLFHG